MTVESQVKNCFSSIKGAQATVDVLASKTKDEKSQKVYEQVSQILTEVKDDLQNQIIFISQEEPQYKP